MKILLSSLLLLVVSVSIAGQQTAKSLMATNGQVIPYLQFLPPGYGAEKHPLIIFLHGIGERGTNPNNIAAGPIPRLLTGGTSFAFTNGTVSKSFVVLSPQLSTSYSNWQNFYVDEMLKYAKANLNIDTSRIYLTGLSLGGGGVWSAMNDAKLSSQFAAIAPVCGTCALNTIGAKNIASKGIAVWAFHAANDPIVPVACTDNAISLINSFTQTPAQVYIFPAGGHNIWEKVYDTLEVPNLYQWFLNFSKVQPLPPVDVPAADYNYTISKDSLFLDASISTGVYANWDAYDWNVRPQTGSWNFIMIGGRYGGPKKILHKLTPGTYSVTLTVKNAGEIASTTKIITVGGALPPARVIKYRFNFYAEGLEYEVIIYDDKTATIQKK